jgi:TolA-binding protein
MKSTERHQLKQDKFLMTLNDAVLRMERHRRYIIGAVATAAVVIVAAGGYAWWRQSQTSKASALLAEALVVAETPLASAAEGTPPEPPAGSTYPSERARHEAALPKFIAAAEAYPKTQSGLAARYHAAATLVALGRDEEAATRFQEVVELGGDGIYGRVARLGLADVNVRRGQYEPAINAYKELSLDGKGELPVDGILMQLGRTYQLAGRTPEAVQSFKRITEEFPASPYAADARRELDALEPGA